MSQKKLVHVTQVPIRWGDMDVYEHVNNTIYFRYAEQARIEWMENLGHRLSLSQTQGPVIVNASCTFLVPLTYPGTVEVRMLIGPPGRSSVETYYEMRMIGQDRLYADGSAKVVWVDLETGKSCPIPDALRELMLSDAP